MSQALNLSQYTESHLISHNNLMGSVLVYTHYVDEETEVQRGEVTFSRQSGPLSGKGRSH